MDQRTDSPVIDLKRLTAGYGDLAAVRDISLHVERGEVVGLFGPNGAGKSTTLLASVGLLPASSGTATWNGSPKRRGLHQLAKQGVAFVPEGRSVITSLNVRDNLRLHPTGVGPVLNLFPELEPLLDRPAGLLSGGEQQMLAVGRALARRPSALLVDELSLGLAPLVVERLLGAIRHAADSYGLAVLLVEQQARRALSVLDRWYLLTNGSVRAEGTAADGTEVLEAAYHTSLAASGPLAPRT